MLRLQVIIASVRPGRAGKPIGTWFYNFAKNHGAFEVEQVDLAEVNLPFMDEPAHPRLRQYTRQHTKDWSATVERGDAYVLVTPEYNYGYPPSLKNALDFVYVEWNNKPVAFVSYGGLSGGTRSVQQLKQIVGALQMFALNDSVTIPFFSQYMDDQGEFKATEAHEKSAAGMLDQLAKYAETFKGLRKVTPGR